MDLHSFKKFYRKKLRILWGMPSQKVRNDVRIVPVLRVDSFPVRSSSITHFPFSGRSYSFDSGNVVVENGLLPISYR
ncbi:hypothetical protein PGB90_004524 [Kerria lacca]